MSFALNVFKKPSVNITTHYKMYFEKKMKTNCRNVLQT